MGELRQRIQGHNAPATVPLRVPAFCLAISWDFVSLWTVTSVQLEAIRGYLVGSFFFLALFSGCSMPPPVSEYEKEQPPEIQQEQAINQIETAKNTEHLPEVCQEEQQQPCQVAQKGACGDGFSVCRNGKWQPCIARHKPTEEKCDGIDNDCDGLVDEDFPLLKQPCSVGQGNCQQQGVYVCNAQGSAVECSAQPLIPKPERCDGKDNDCNGKIDETFALDQDCFVGQGACRNRGKTVCNADGSGVQCNATAGIPQPEICDGIDNDCNGKIDDECKKP